MVDTSYISSIMPIQHVSVYVRVCELCACIDVCVCVHVCMYAHWFHVSMDTKTSAHVTQPTGSR